MRDVFLCHASANKEEFAGALYTALVNEGIAVWYDEAEIQWGDSIAATIQKGLSTSRYVLVLVKPEFLDESGKWRYEELNAALSAQIEAGKTSVLVVVCNVSHEVLRVKLPFVASRRYETLNSQADIPRIAKKVGNRVIEETRPMLLRRTEVDPAIGSVETRIAAARRQICISGNDCKFVAESLSPCVETALRAGKRVNILCVDPDSAAAEMLPKIDQRFPTPEYFRESVRSVESTLRTISKAGPGLELRYLPILPAIGFFITDPDDSAGIVKVEVYASSKPNQLLHRPHIVLGQGTGGWREYFLQQWSLYWSLGRSVSFSDG